MFRRPDHLLHTILLVFAAVASPLTALAEEPVSALTNAHAHNDYYHERPLLDALDNGFCSVEADIFLVDGMLLVGHAKFELKPERSLECLYLSPLKERITKNGGRVHSDADRFVLLVDIKEEGEKTYQALHTLLARYNDILTRVEDGKVTPGAVAVIVSGDRPVDLMTGQETRYAGIDGRLGDLDSDLPAHLLPLISDHWGRNFRWQGLGPMPEEEREKLRSIVGKAHEKGRLVRFWAIPHREALWSELQSAGVDLINADDLPRLRRFFAAKGQ